MTIPTPTSEGLAGLAGAVPAGLPDEVTLARLAGEFFAALPTGFGGASALSLPNAPRAPAPGWPAEPSEEASVGRGKTYYHFAYSYSQQINRRHPAITEVLEKLSVGFDRYIKILSHMRGEYLDLVNILSQGEVYHLERNVDKERERESLRQMQDEFLDCYIEWKRTGR